MRDSNAWLGDYKHKHDSRLRAVKDRATGKVETERMPGQVWLALRSLYADSLFVPSVAARASKALTKRQGRVRRTSNHRREPGLCAAGWYSPFIGWQSSIS